MTNEKFLEMAKEKVYEYEHKRGNHIKLSDVYIIWSCKTLQNSKALFSVSNKEKRALYYEFTLNGDKGEFYMDAYEKLDNICFDFKGDIKNEITKCGVKLQMQKQEL